MRERVLAIVSLLAQFVLENREFLSETEIVEELLSEGFAADEIDAAFTWMESMSLQPRSSSPASLPPSSHRVFTPEECRTLNLEARGFLVKLRTMGILDDDLQEEVIGRALDEGGDEVTLKDVKTLTALSLFARSQADWQREVDCILDDDWSRLYH